MVIQVSENLRTSTISEGDWLLSTPAKGVPRCVLIRLILGFWRSNVPQNGRFPAQDPYRAKFDAASFSLAGEIGNRTNKQKNKQ